MPTDPVETTVFLFAHQDDEIGCFETLRRTIAAGNDCIVFYLTNGNWRGNSSSRRNQESLRVLEKMGVARNKVHFLGGELDIADGNLPDSMQAVFDAVVDRIPVGANIFRFIFLAWEGGHQDHDAAHVIGLALAAKFGVVSTSRQFMLYRAGQKTPLPFLLFNPLAENGPVEALHVPLWSRFAYLFSLAVYRTQWKVMTMFLPFVVYQYFVRRHEFLQPVSLARIREKPHVGDLLYEKRKRFDFVEMQKRAGAFLGEVGLW